MSNILWKCSFNRLIKECYKKMPQHSQLISYCQVFKLNFLFSLLWKDYKSVLYTSFWWCASDSNFSVLDFLNLLPQSLWIFQSFWIHSQLAFKIGMYIYHFFNAFQSIEFFYLKRKKLIFLVLHPVLDIKEIPSKMPRLENCVPDVFSHRIHNKQWKTPKILVFLLDYYKGTVPKDFMQWCMVACTCEPSTLESFKVSYYAWAGIHQEMV